MYCIRKITDDLTWVGANDRRLAMFEGVYSVPYGVSYNSYLLTDEKTVLIDTVDKAVRQRFLENIGEALKGRALDYLVLQHIEPDHSAVVCDIILRWPEVKIVCGARALEFIKQFYEIDTENRVIMVDENTPLNTGKHTLNFIMAPMVHWPEVMVSYDPADKILFSADAFGCFGALNGALFADEVDFNKDYMDEARRYYANIVGKYGTQAEALLNKAAALEIEMICPLHGFVWRKNLKEIISKYELWSTYEPEEKGVMLAYASVYGNTENAAEILACRLREAGVKTVMFDVSVTPASEIVSAAFKWSHFVFASTTYNAGIFVTMEALVNDLAAHNIQNRTAAIIENGSWAPTSGGLIREKLEKCKNITILENTISIKSGVKKEQLKDIEAVLKAIVSEFPELPENINKQTGAVPEASGVIERGAMFKLSYGLFILTAKDGKKDNGCIINTAAQVTDNPLRISVTVNKANFTCEMIMKTGSFNVSVLSESAPFALFKQFGFSSGKDADKFKDMPPPPRTENGIAYIPTHTNCVISAEVTASHDCGSHMLFIADVTRAFINSSEPSATYQYYFDNIKPGPPKLKTQEDKKGFICKICGYVYEGEVLPGDYICPLCKHGAEDFDPV
ncbi:MAG: flavin reductase [Oscillospiraceae bacterium]|nr:flavin reductase [Oscillospiraceae bacterium]